MYRSRSVAAIAFITAGCYDVPRPACGFACGPAFSCPAGYTCGADAYCRLDGTPMDLSCPVLDAAVDAEPPIPVVTSVVPDDKQMNIPTDITLVARFNKPVDGVSATSFTLTMRDASSPVAAVVSYDPATHTAYLDPDGPLFATRAYDAVLGPEITDRHGSTLTGTTGWSFLTANDTTPPTVTATSPTDGTTGVGVDVTLLATFSEPVSASTANWLLEGPNGLVTGSIGYVSQTAFRFTPAVQLAPHAAHTATLTSDVTDPGGNPLVGAPVSWTFTTGADTIAPVISTRNPVEDETDVSLTAKVTVIFSEPVVGVSSATMTLQQQGTPVAATVTYNAGARLARLTPDALLAPNTTYTVTLSAAIADGSGNALPGAPVSWLFTTSSR